MNRDDIRKLIEQDPEAIIDLIEKLFARIEELERRLNKDSHNSNRPPSSDGLNRKERRVQERKSRKKRGGQNGHEGSQLKMRTTPDRTEIHRVSICRNCHGSLNGIEAKEFKKRQVFDLLPVSLEVTEHQTEIKECPHCGAITAAEFPEGVTRPTQYGSTIKGISTYLSQHQLIPYERVAELLKDIFDVSISKGTIYNINREAYETGAATEEAIKIQLEKQSLLHADETGVFCGGSLKWMHVLSTERLTYYCLHERRGKDAIAYMGIIPEFRGHLMHDFWSSYLTYDCKHVFCNAHLLRELTSIHEDFEQKWALQMANLLVNANRRVKARRNYLNNATIGAIEAEYDRIILQGFRRNPDTRNGPVRRGRKRKSKPRNLLERMRDYKDGILGFARDFTIPFDNNQAERDLRMIKVQQKISGCFRSCDGGVYFARIRGYISTVRKQNQNVLIALQGLFENRPFMPEFAE